MISVPVVNISGGEVGKYELDPADLASGINKQLLHDVVVMYEANRRVGTVRTKSRGMVNGSTRKLYRQKGTGRARAGAARTPVRRGGGHTFAKVPRDYSYRLPRKAVQKATRMALLSKFEDEQAKVVDKLSLDNPSTKTVAEMLKAIGFRGESVLLATAEHNPTVVKSARNIQGVRVVSASDLNAYDLLRQRYLIIEQAGIDAVRSRAASAGPANNKGEES